MTDRKLGIAVIGLGGAVGTTMVAGIELLKKGVIGTEGLPLANLEAELTEDLAKYENIVFGGWDLHGVNLATAAEEHDVLTHKQFVAVEEELRQIKPWRAVGNKKFLENIEGENTFTNLSHREVITKIQADLQSFKKMCDQVVIINLASTEKLAIEGNEIFNSIAGFEKALDENSADIAPAMLYAYATIAEQVPYGNFTPSVGADIPALVEFAIKMEFHSPEKMAKPGRR